MGSVTEYGSDYTTALPALTFNYQVKPFQFGPDTDWTGQYSQGQTGAGWNSIRGWDSSNESFVSMSDIDGDGLPDRILRPVSAPYNSFTTERNRGNDFYTYLTFFGSGYSWSPLDSQGQTGIGWNSLTSIDTSGATFVDLIDINGDGYLYGPKPHVVTNAFGRSYTY